MTHEEYCSEYLNYYKTLPSQIEYDTTTQYRNIIRKIFRFDSKKVSCYGDESIDYDLNSVDEESKDELLFDSHAIQIHMDILLLSTINVPLFKDLYVKAATLFFSTDPTIGQVALCSFDTFSWYHTCIWHFLHFGNLYCDEYTKLIHYL